MVRGVGKQGGNLEGGAQRCLAGHLEAWPTACAPGEALSPDFDRQERESRDSRFVQMHIFLPKLRPEPD